MATNFIQDGKTLTLTAPTGGVVSGGAYLIGGLLVVASFSADAGQEFEGCASGVFELPKKSSDSMTAGAPIYWDNTNFEFTTTVSGKYTQGTCAVAAAASTTTVKVKLHGFGVVVNP